jgi:hypothetical protein
MPPTKIVAGGGQRPESDEDRLAGRWYGFIFATVAFLVAAGWLLNRLADWLEGR